MVMRNLKRDLWVSLMIVGALCTMTGCSPSVQPLQQPALGSGVISLTGLVNLEHAVELGEKSGKYKIKSDVQLLQNTMHTDFSVYGSVDLPNRASVSFHENNFMVSFYQQGQSAYALENAKWAPTAAVSGIDSFQSYGRLLQYVAESQTKIYQMKDLFGIDELCHVYQFTVSGADVAQLSMFTNGFKLNHMSPVLYTFYVGVSSHSLVEVKTQSVGAIAGFGGIEVNSDTVLFDQGKPSAEIQIPNDLVKQLEGKS